MRFPTDITTLTQALRDLAHEVPRPRLAHLAYRAHFEILSASADLADFNTIITDRTTPIWVRCGRHDHEFVSSVRKLFNHSLVSWTVTCPLCDFDAGYRAHSVHTYQSLAAGLVVAGVPFRLDPEQVPDDPPVRILQFDDRIPLVCTNLLKDGAMCGYPVTHSVGNILETIKKGGLYCQGPCDAKKKGKARRVAEATVAADLQVARAGTYTIVPGSYRKKSAHVQVVHAECGISSSRRLDHVISFPVVAGKDPATADDCPYCHIRTPRKRQPSPEQYQAWLDRATESAVTYRSGSLAPQDTDTVPLAVTCRVCGTDFEATELQLTRNVASGCPICTEEIIHQQRAWVLADAQQLAAVRGYVLQNDPGSYLAPADLVTVAGVPSGFSTLLELVQAWPATAAGFGRPEPEPVKPGRGGEPYSAEEIAVVRAGHQANRSKADLARKLGRSYGSLSQKCQDLGLRFDEKEHVNRRMTVQDDFFTVPSPRSAYWAGLLAADGCLGKAVSIELKGCDEGVLQQFMRELGYSGTLSYRVVEQSTEGRGIYAGLRFQSGQIVRDLQQRYQLTARKSKTLAPPDLTDPDLIFGYLGGLLDGDGSIKLDRSRCLRVSLVSASLELAQWVADQVDKLLGIETVVHLRTPRGLDIYEVLWHGRRAEQILSAVAGVNTSPMARKWDVWVQYRMSRAQKGHLSPVNAPESRK